MLGILRMDVDSCIKQYCKLGPIIFPLEDRISGSKFGKILKMAAGKDRFNPKPFEKELKRLLQENLIGRSSHGGDTRMRFETSSGNSSVNCKV
jgi:hypothetical protein